MICKIELIDTRIAAYMPLPLARRFHIKHMAMHRAIPTRMTPSRSSGLSGRHAHAKASYQKKLGPSRCVKVKCRDTNHQEGAVKPVYDHAEPNLFPYSLFIKQVVQRLVLDSA